MLPAPGLSDHSGGHERHAGGQAGHAPPEFGLAFPLSRVCVVHVNVLHPVAPVVGAPTQDVDAAVQHSYAGFSMSRREGGH